MTGQSITDYERTGDANACRAAVAAARAIDPEMRVGNNMQSLDEFEAAVCAQLEAVVPPWVAKARAALRQRNEAAAAPYVAAGVGGQKLDLIVSYAGVYWRLPGGERTDNPSKLARASVLFQWLEAEDRIDPRYLVHTIRRYQFNGNALSGVTEKEYRRLKGTDLGDVFR